MDDPLYTNYFIKNIIEHRKNNIIGVAIPNGNRLTLSKGKSRLEYVFSLLLIMGPFYFFKNSFITLKHKFYNFLFKFSLIKDPSVLGYAKSLGINTYRINSPNESSFIDIINNLNVDVIINQSQSIIKKKLLLIPKIGVINRHNALLPKNRGRLTPFWVLYKSEKKTGVSIHFVEESLDSGDIIVQESFKIENNDTFNSLVKKNYKIANKLILIALDKLEIGDKNYIKNEDQNATYNSTPTFFEALNFRLKIILKFFNK